MSKFKTNSRCGSLVEKNLNSKEFKNNKVDEQSTTEKRSGDNNSFKKNTNRYERAEDYCARRAKEENFKKEEERRLKEENTIKSLAPESFPDLISKPLNLITPNYTSFSKKLQSLVINNNDDKTTVDLDYKNLIQGWSLIKRDEKTNKIIIKKKEILAEISIHQKKLMMLENELLKIEHMMASFSEMNVADSLSLSDQQKVIVESKDKNILVVACPGSGKTHTLISRYINLVTKEKVDPSNIILITFTKKAGMEMNQRISNIIPHKLPYYVGSLHGLGFRLLQEYHKISYVIVFHSAACMRGYN
jgi:hypothetical protein